MRHDLCYSEFRACALIRQTVMCIYKLNIYIFPPFTCISSLRCHKEMQNNVVNLLKF